MKMICYSKSAKKLFIRTIKLLLLFYVLICIALYFFQEKLIFFPDKFDKNYRFAFDQPFEEINISTGNGNILNALLFKSDNAQGLIFYLHGNAGSLNNWGGVAKRYTALHYDVFILDYPGYGKSTGSIKSQSQLFTVVQKAYDEMKKIYSEKQMVVLGYSIGTGPAAHLASQNNPKLLILQAPYYSLKDMMRHTYPVIPVFLLKYKLETNRYLKDCRMPVVIFHGKEDNVIPHSSSVRLKESLKTGDTLITLNGQGHDGITDNSDYIKAIGQILN